RRAERAVAGRALVRGLLRLRADDDRGVAVAPEVELLVVERGRDEVAGRVPVEPLVLVEDEAERADQAEVGGGQRRQRVDVAGDLGGGPAVGELAQLGGEGVGRVGGVGAHGVLLPSCPLVGARPRASAMPSPCRYMRGGLLPASCPPSIGIVTP